MRGEFTETYSTKLSKREARIIEACAKSEGVTVSTWLRSAALTTAVMDGNLEAMKLCAGFAAEKFKRFAESQVLQGERLTA